MRVRQSLNASNHKSEQTGDASKSLVTGALSFQRACSDSATIRQGFEDNRHKRPVPFLLASFQLPSSLPQERQTQRHHGWSDHI